MFKGDRIMAVGIYNKSVKRNPVFWGNAGFFFILFLYMPIYSLLTIKNGAFPPFMWVQGVNYFASAQSVQRTSLFSCVFQTGQLRETKKVLY